jgi:DHA2 family methylenomycin A resistance protein-like MFS transporter
LAAATLGFAVVQLDVTVVNVGITRIGAEFGGGTAALQWVVSAYTLMFAAVILTAGALSDRVGARQVLGAGFASISRSRLATDNSPPADARSRSRFDG